MIFRPEGYARKHLYVQYCIRMEITVLYFWHYSLCIIQFCFATIVANRFPSLSDVELQSKHCLKIATALKHTKSNKQAHIRTKTFNLLKKKHTYRHKHSELASLECQGSVVQSKSYQNIGYFFNKLTALRRKEL